VVVDKGAIKAASYSGNNCRN